jgi:hypothetical protein
MVTVIVLGVVILALVPLLGQKLAADPARRRDAAGDGGSVGFWGGDTGGGADCGGGDGGGGDGGGCD